VRAENTRSCFFWTGPRTGGVGLATQVQPCGSQCFDGQSSWGYHVPDGDRPRKPWSWPGMPSDNNPGPQCQDICGVSVPYKPNDNIPKTGLATFEGSNPVIYIKFSQLNSQSLNIHKYLYAHECGHHALGQIRGARMYNANLGPEFELATDCYAMQEVKRNGILDGGAINEILGLINTLPADPFNYPGPERVRRIKTCF